MGNNDSKQRSPHRVNAELVNNVAKCLRVKSENEKIMKDQLFHALRWSSQQNPITEQLWDFLCEGSSCTRLSNIVDLLDNILYADYESQGKCLARVLQGPPNDAAFLYALHLINLLDTLENPANSSWKGVGVSMSDQGMDLLAHSLVDGLDTSIHDKEMLLQECLEKKPLLRQMQAAVFQHLFLLSPASSSCLLPVLTTQLSQKPRPSVLDKCDILFINHALPHDMQSEWSLIFSTNVHGLSFTSMLAKITNKGPNIIIICDSKGHWFGGFAPVSWAVSPKFAGDERSFLFRLRPEMSIYQSTGYNDHFMYLNHQQQTMPNGLGMGGQLGHFGVWIDADFGTGHSSEGCSTYYKMPSLSSGKDFVVDHIEVWAVGPPPKEDSDDEPDGKRSILDRDTGAKAILEMVDRGHHSEGLRDIPDD